MFHIRWLVMVLFAVGWKACALRLNWSFSTGSLQVSGTFIEGVCTLQRAESPGGPWVNVISRYTTGPETRFQISALTLPGFFRAVSRNLAPGDASFDQFTASYSMLSTLAGNGGSGGTDNKWLPEFEGKSAANALLSRPHMALGDDAGNIYIADKESHGIRRVSPDGTIHTHAGINTPGDGPDTPTPARQLALNQPNGLWVRGDGTVYILDTGNSKVRRVDTNGICETLFEVTGGSGAGRGLWVADDESVAYTSSSSVVKKRTPGGGVVNFATGFSDLGNLHVNPKGELVVTDRAQHRVFRIQPDGSKIAIAGNGTGSGGGDNQPALDTGLNGVRGVWFLPTGAYLLATSTGSQVWYVDTAGIIHLLLHGARSSATHAGDGEWFYAPNEPRMSEARAVTADRQGNILVTENDRGYVRKIRFLPR